jgi:hypothetical protein
VQEGGWHNEDFSCVFVQGYTPFLDMNQWKIFRIPQSLNIAAGCQVRRA